jgi:uncharacterized membrane protein YgdD (TMEM256/DUF423 family)
MSMHGRVMLAVAGLSLLCATIGGAAASHALSHLDAAALRAFGTAVDFQFFHGLGLIGVTVAAERYPHRRALRLCAWLLVAGTVLFCGSIYATSFGAPAAIGSLAPAGGIALMAAWLVLAVAMIPADRTPAA